jgi:hypothetical protein
LHRLIAPAFAGAFHYSMTSSGMEPKGVHALWRNPGASLPRIDVYPHCAIVRRVAPPAGSMRATAVLRRRRAAEKHDELAVSHSVT